MRLLLLLNDLSESSIPDGRCGHEFKWNNTEVLTSARIKRTGEKVSEVDFGKISIKNQSCYRKTIDGGDQCEWHTRENTQPSSKMIEKEHKYANKVIPDAQLEISCSDLSELALPYSTFTDELRDVDLSRSVLSYAQFSQVVIEGVDFSGAHLEEASFIRSKIDLSRDWGTKTKFTNCILDGVDFSYAKFNRTDFSGSSFSQNSEFSDEQNISGTQFMNCTLANIDLSNVIARECDFTESDLRDVNFSGAILAGASFKRANCLGTVFENAQLENSSMSQANLKSADLKDSELDAADFAGSRINHDTEFGNQVVYEKMPESSNTFENSSRRSLKAIWSYRTLTRLHKENALLNRASHFYKREKDLRRRQHRSEIFNSREFNTLNEYQGGNKSAYRISIFCKYIKSECSRLSIRYGESPYQLALFSGIGIVIFALIYPLFGIRINGELIKYSFVSNSVEADGLVQQFSYFIDILSYSFFTFVRLSVDNAQTAGLGKFVTAVEAVFGTSIIALLVFILTRRATS